MIGLRSAFGSLNCQHQPLPELFVHRASASGASFCLAILIALLPLIGAVTASSTVSEGKQFTDAELDLIRKNFLKRFNMTEQPAQRKPSLPVPNYVWNLYDKVQNEDIDSIRHYYPTRIMEAEDRMLLLRYNLTVTVQNISDERVIGAILKLKLNKGIRHRRVKIHEVDQRNPEILRLIDSRPVEPDQSKDHQWVDMDVSEALTRRRPDTQRVDFAVEISDGGLASTLSPSVATVSAIPYSRTQEAALVVYIQSNDASRSRKKRRAGERRKRQHRSKNHRKESKLCRRRELTIDFKQLGWNDWILAPPSYKAYQCQGECPYPLPNSMNTTNHAIVQGILNSIDPDRVPPPCCVPIEMESLAILYIDVEGKIVVKKYPDMEVKTCGCR